MTTPAPVEPDPRPTEDPIGFLLALATTSDHDRLLAELDRDDD
ncbi:hypothetical protein [Streptomyces jumonjinensis]